MKKVRLDQLVFDQGLSESRERAKAIIMSGVVYVNGQRADKPGAGFTVMGLDYSPIKGPEGNIEYLGYLRKGTHPAPELDPAAVVEQSHGALAHGKESSV